MDDKRKIERVHLVHYLRIFDRETGVPIGNLVDVTPEGMKLLSEKPMEKDTEFNIRMNFPEPIQGKRFLTFDAKSVWCEPDTDDPALFAIGFLSYNLSEEDNDILKYLMHLYRDDEGA